MNTRNKIITLIALICFGILPLSTVQAAKIGKNSCGGEAVPNAYCGFDDDGDGIQIGKDSCNVEGACTELGNGVKIGNNSCNGEDACDYIGSSDGEAVIGNDHVTPISL